MPGKLVDLKQYELYNQRITRVEAAALAASEYTGEYWWNLWLIYSEESWRSVTDDGKFTTWLGDFTHSSYGSSAQTFYNRMNAIKKWFALGMKPEQVQLLLGSRSEMALQHDINEWFEKNGSLKENVAQKILDGHETPPQYLERVSELSPGEARKEVQRLTERDIIFPLADEVLYDEKTGVLLFKLRWDNEVDGMIWKGTVQVTAVQEAPEVSKKYLPQKVAAWLAKRIGVRL